MSARTFLIYVSTLFLAGATTATCSFAHNADPDPAAQGRAAVAQANSIPVAELFEDYLRNTGVAAVVSGCRFITTAHMARDISYAAICELRTSSKTVTLPMCGDTLVGKFVLNGGFYSATPGWVSSFLARDCPAGG